MATSIIPYDYRPINLGYTGTTGSVTAQFPASPRRAYLICTSHGFYYLYWTSDTSDAVNIQTIWSLNGGTVTVTDNGNWNVTISGLVWYTNVFAIRGWI